jgi:hypothetical protein
MLLGQPLGPTVGGNRQTSGKTAVNWILLLKNTIVFSYDPSE